jgi:hypothetical protein
VTVQGSLHFVCELLALPKRMEIGTTIKQKKKLSKIKIKRQPQQNEKATSKDKTRQELPQPPSGGSLGRPCPPHQKQNR